jgi:hypothetical protein
MMIEAESVGAGLEARGRSARRCPLGLLLVLTATACGSTAESASSEGEGLASASQAFTEQGCLTGGRDAVLANGESFQSPESYTRAGCLGALIIGVEPFKFRGVISIRDTSAPPTNRVDCESVGLFADFHLELDSAGTAIGDVQLQTENRRGAFSPPSLCVVPSLEFEINQLTAGLDNDEVEAARSVRAVVHGGTFNFEGPGTRAFEISYRDP